MTCSLSPSLRHRRWRLRRGFIAVAVVATIAVEAAIEGAAATTATGDAPMMRYPLRRPPRFASSAAVRSSSTFSRSVATAGFLFPRGSGIGGNIVGMGDRVSVAPAADLSLRQRRFSPIVAHVAAAESESRENSDSGDDGGGRTDDIEKGTIGDRENQRGSSRRSSPSFPPPPEPSSFPSWSYEPRDFFRFETLYESKKSLARVGRIHTPHGVVDTPGFVAVATNAALKGVDFRDADASGQQLIFCNTYHLMLQPGADVVEGAGGLHGFVNRPNGPFITDSGGFQVFSLAYGSVHEELSSGGELKRRGVKKGKEREDAGGRGGGNNASPVKVTEEGAVFRSYRDGRKILLTPETTVQAQKSLGADIIIPLDELPPYHIDRDGLRRSVELTHRWEARSLSEHLKDVQNQAMYCVVHGGVDKILRTQSVEYLTSLPFDGYAIGGSLGKDADELNDLLTWMMPLFDDSEERIRSKPRHLLGIADETSIQNAVTMGIDTMDSCYPTRLGRHGTLLTREGKVNIKSGRYSRQYGVPIDPECCCSTCEHYDRPYLWHLFKAKEPVFTQLATIHNIQYMNDFMKKQRELILEGKL